MRVDLHLHSSASDGSLSPADLVKAARAGALDVISLTDHDTVAGLGAAIRDAGPTLRVVPGIEISTHFAGGELHMLGYFIDPQNAELLSYTQAAANRRQERMRGMLERLALRNIHITFDEVMAGAGVRPDSVGRPHLARSLVERGHARTVNDAFDRLIGDNSDVYLAVQLVTPAQAIDLIHAAGGIAVWAHPRIDVFDLEVRSMRARGLDGVECYRPRNSPADTQYFEAAAAGLGLIRTGGSDWHGTWHGRLGDYAVNSSMIPEFAERIR